MTPGVVAAIRRTTCPGGEPCARGCGMGPCEAVRAVQSSGEPIDAVQRMACVICHLPLFAGGAAGCRCPLTDQLAATHAACRAVSAAKLAFVLDHGYASLVITGEYLPWCENAAGVVIARLGPDLRPGWLRAERGVEVRAWGPRQRALSEMRNAAAVLGIKLTEDS